MMDPVISFHTMPRFISILDLLRRFFIAGKKKSTGQLHSLTRQLFSRTGGSYGVGWDLSQLKITKNWPFLVPFMRNGHIRRCQIDNFLFFSSLNFTNLTSEEVKRGTPSPRVTRILVPEKNRVMRKPC